jgi:hypothetical protein
VTGSWDSIVGIVIRLQIGQPRNFGLIPSRGWRFISSSKCPDWPTQAPFQLVLGALSPGIRWPGHEADHWLWSNAEVRNGWSYISTLPYGAVACTRTTLPLMPWHNLVKLQTVNTPCSAEYILQVHWEWVLWNDFVPFSATPVSVATI